MRKISFFKAFFWCLILSLSACVNGDVSEKVDFTYAFCDGNSKVWVVNSIHRGHFFIESRNDLTGSVFVFYNSGKFIFGDLSRFYNGQFEKGNYILSSETSYLELHFENKKWTFKYEFEDENHLILRPAKNSESDLTFELIPFPEPI